MRLVTNVIRCLVFAGALLALPRASLAQANEDFEGFTVGDDITTSANWSGINNFAGKFTAQTGTELASKVCRLAVNQGGSVSFDAFDSDQSFTFSYQYDHGNSNSKNDTAALILSQTGAGNPWLGVAANEVNDQLWVVEQSNINSTFGTRTDTVIISNANMSAEVTTISGTYDYGTGLLTVYWTDGITSVTGSHNVGTLVGHPGIWYRWAGAGENYELDNISFAPFSGPTDEPPSIITQPQGQEIPEGQDAAFSVLASGTSPLAYQWYFNGGAISGATNASYNVMGVTSAVTGDYQVIISNAFPPAATSTVAVLTLEQDPPVITTQPFSQTVAEGANASFMVAATGTPPLAYQWHFNGSAIANATNANYDIIGVDASETGAYFAVASNAFVPNATSDVVTLSIDTNLVAIGSYYWSGQGGGDWSITTISNWSFSKVTQTTPTNEPWPGDLAVFDADFNDKGMWLSWHLDVLALKVEPSASGAFLWLNGDGSKDVIVRGTTIEGVSNCVVHSTRGGVTINKGRLMLSGGGDKVVYHDSGSEFKVEQGLGETDGSANLIVQGGGRFRVNGPVAISGDITIRDAGTVFRTESDFTLPLSSLIVDPDSTGARFNIQPDGGSNTTYVVGALIVQGVSQPTGTYTSVELQAAGIAGSFEGGALGAGLSDTIVVVSGVASGPEITAFDLLNGGPDAVITWDARAGAIYGVQQSSDGLMTWPVTVASNLTAMGASLSATVTLSEVSAAYRLDEIPPGPLFEEDFESGLNGWTTGVVGAAGTSWELGTPTTGPGSAKSPSNCWGTNLDAGYAPSANCWLRSPPIDLTGVNPSAIAILSFWHAVDTELSFPPDFYDYGVVNLLETDLTPIVTELGGKFWAEDASPSWTEKTSTLPPEALGKSIVVEFQFISDDFVDFDGAGWYIDDVSVVEP